METASRLPWTAKPCAEPSRQARRGHARPLAAYLPREGIGLFQVAVESKTNEIGAAPQVLKALDLRGKIVMGDALLTQRELSIQIVAAEGDYIWMVKDNQPSILGNIFGPCSDLKVTLHQFAAQGFSHRPYCQQRPWPFGRTDADHQQFAERLSGSALRPAGLSTRAAAGPSPIGDRGGRGRLWSDEPDGGPSRPTELLQAIRDYWGIENGLHGLADTTFHEDATRVTTLPSLAEGLAILNNLP